MALKYGDLSCMQVLFYCKIIIIYVKLRGDFVCKVTKEGIIESIKALPENQQEILRYLMNIFEGEEETINNFIKKELTNSWYINHNINWDKIFFI